MQADGNNRQIFHPRETSQKSPAGSPQGIIVAIDGPASSGKSTVGKESARSLGFLYIDTGQMYRGVAWKALKTGWEEGEEDLARLARETEIAYHQEGEEERVLVDDQDVTSSLSLPEVSKMASKIATSPMVRQVLVRKQRELVQEAFRRGKSEKLAGVVMVGRDITSVVFPDAHVKIFLDASLEERGRRRYLQLREEGAEVTLQGVMEGLHERDLRDSTRSDSPLVEVADAIRLDTTSLTIQEVVDRIAWIVLETQRRLQREISS